MSAATFSAPSHSSSAFRAHFCSVFSCVISHCELLWQFLINSYSPSTLVQVTSLLASGFYRADLLMTAGRVSQLALSKCMSRHIGLWRTDRVANFSLFCEDFVHTTHTHKILFFFRNHSLCPSVIGMLANLIPRFTGHGLTYNNCSSVVCTPFSTQINNSTKPL
jgi:hypothetical protein